MNLTKISEENTCGGFVAANQHATELWAGDLNGVPFTVLLDSCGAPRFTGDVDEDAQNDIMAELSELSGL